MTVVRRVRRPTKRICGPVLHGTDPAPWLVNRHLPTSRLGCRIPEGSHAPRDEALCVDPLDVRISQHDGLEVSDGYYDHLLRLLEHAVEGETRSPKLVRQEPDSTAYRHQTGDPVLFENPTYRESVYPTRRLVVLGVRRSS